MEPQEPTQSMYWRLSASKMREPWPCSMNGGVPPTARNARTGEFTPPGMISCARWKSASDCLPIGVSLAASRVRSGISTLPRKVEIPDLTLLPLFAPNDQFEAGPHFIDSADFDVDKSHRQRDSANHIFGDAGRDLCPLPLPGYP